MAGEPEKDVDQSQAESSGGNQEMSAVMEILEDCGIEEYDQRVIGILTDAQVACATRIMEMVDAITKHENKPQADVNDVQTAVEILGLFKNNLPDRQRQIQLGAERNAQALPTIRHNFGLKLPNDRFCQLQPNIDLRTNDMERIPQNMMMSMDEGPLEEEPLAVLRPEHVQNLLQRQPNDDFDS
ncbi:unnamed protein product [Caenorhabditis auriculariae]|uniref:Uncharacterized protein n=1 Tax=Caenorhabditis auriculariae TaxID=2777116 RepID=A0A8S1GRE9_9PELO|nr:unnamed protein product [Caenorhabditis auriculariae]